MAWPHLSPIARTRHSHDPERDHDHEAAAAVVIVGATAVVGAEQVAWPQLSPIRRSYNDETAAAAATAEPHMPPRQIFHEISPPSPAALQPPLTAAVAPTVTAAAPTVAMAAPTTMAAPAMTAAAVGDDTELDSFTEHNLSAIFAALPDSPWRGGRDAVGAADGADGGRRNFVDPSWRLPTPTPVAASTGYDSPFFLVDFFFF